MKHFLITLFTGKPRKGEPITYFNHERVSHTAVPFNVDYDIWQQAVKQFGYQDVINYFKKIYK